LSDRSVAEREFDPAQSLVERRLYFNCVLPNRGDKIPVELFLCLCAEIENFSLVFLESACHIAGNCRHYQAAGFAPQKKCDSSRAV
jgi:hypothetical protein